MTVYLAGPINGCTDDEATNWREEAKKQLRECLDPMRRDYRGSEADSVSEIVSGDIADIEHSDAILANCWQPSFGTAMELWHASQVLKKPVITMAKPGAPVSPWLQFVSTLVVTSLSDAIAALREMGECSST